MQLPSWFYPQRMATTHTPISAANVPFLARLRRSSHPLSSRSVVKCSNPLDINGRVELANRELPKIEKQETEVRNMMGYVNQLETRISEIAEVQKESLMEEAEHDAMVMRETERKTMYKNKEKLESVKAAVISAIVGALASLPMSFTHVTNTHELAISTAITISACALYGGTFRYAVRRDLDDFHLKTGTSAAFGIVKGLATLDGRPSLEQEAGGLLPDALNGVVCVSENVLIFLFAAAGLDIFMSRLRGE